MSRPIWEAGYYEFVQGKSAKFWECLMSGDGTYRIRWGRIGTKGQSQGGISSMVASDRARKKEREGYVLRSREIQTVVDHERKLLVEALSGTGETCPEETENAPADTPSPRRARARI